MSLVMTHEILLTQISDMSSEGLDSTSLVIDDAHDKPTSLEKLLLELNLRQDAGVILASATISADLVCSFLNAMAVDLPELPPVLPTEIHSPRSFDEAVALLRSRTPTGCKVCIVHPFIPFFKGLHKKLKTDLHPEEERVDVHGKVDVEDHNKIVEAISPEKIRWMLARHIVRTTLTILMLASLAYYG